MGIGMLCPFLPSSCPKMQCPQICARRFTKRANAHFPFLIKRSHKSFRMTCSCLKILPLSEPLMLIIYYVVLTYYLAPWDIHVYTRYTNIQHTPIPFTIRNSAWPHSHTQWGVKGASTLFFLAKMSSQIWDNSQ